MTSTQPAVHSGTISLGDDLHVNRMGYGAMRITGRGVFGPPADRAECIRVLRRAVDLGVTFIDTADSYGPNVSEELIAEALWPYKSTLVIATKGGFERPGPDNWVTNGRPEHLRAALEGSLRRLRLDRIDLWQLHRIDPKVPEDEQFGVLAEFIREGKVRHVGLSEVDADEVRRARRIVPIVSVQNKFNVADRKWNHVVDYCEQERLAFIPWYPLGAGSIDDTRARKAVKTVAERHGASEMQVALAWLLERSPAMLVIPGTSKVKHLEENVAAADLQLDASDMDLLDKSA
jgi:aryl-alcohol dehydrogenase-like predicted oxidoreductase